MRPDYNLCDVCNQKADAKSTIFLVTDRPRLPTGELGVDGQYIDLCGLCAAAMFKKAVDHVDGHQCFGMAEWALAEIEKGKAAYGKQ